jgi:uncharacterized membrane protein YhaH (DUF805 family)
MKNDNQNELKQEEVDIEQQTVEKPPMFKHCFSFCGRIRRLEYGLSVLIYCACAIGLRLLLEFVFSDDVMILLTCILYIPAILFMLSQSARRCHDLGKSGLYQVIPFYIIILLFADSDIGRNEYGENPKGRNSVFN